MYSLNNKKTGDDDSWFWKFLGWAVDWVLEILDFSVKLYWSLEIIDWWGGLAALGLK